MMVVLLAAIADFFFLRAFLKCLMSRIDIRIILIVQIKGNFLPIYFKPLLTTDPYTLYQNYEHQNILTRSKSLCSLYNCFIYSCKQQLLLKQTRLEELLLTLIRLLIIPSTLETLSW